MYKITSKWTNAPKWPGPDTMSTTQFMHELGASLEDISFGIELIYTLNPVYVNFVETNSTEYDSNVSWITEIYFEDKSGLDLLVEYLTTKAKTEANLLNFDVEVVVEEL